VISVDSKQLDKNSLLFPHKNRAYRRCRPNNSPHYHLVTEVVDRNGCMATNMSTCSANSKVQFALLKAVNLYLLIYHWVLQ